MKVTLALLILLIAQTTAQAAVAPPRLVERLTGIRTRVMDLEQQIIDSSKVQKEAKNNIKRIQALMKLQHQEKDLCQARLEQLEHTIGELETRRGVLRERILIYQRQMRQSLVEIHHSMNEVPRTKNPSEREALEAPRRKILSNLVERGLKEVEALKVDLADADELEKKISEEKEQLAYLFQDMKEKEGILELNRQLQADLLEKKHEDRVSQLENYRRLKNAEGQVETLIQQFNARIELEKAVETERKVSKAMIQGTFAKNKGSLPLPVPGKIISSFGRAFDSKSSLYIFKKGIDIETGKKQTVRAVSSGKIAYSGELPNYGRIAIIDHGDHFYSLCGHLGDLSKKTGEMVAAGESIGVTDDLGTPVYFEIRARNVAVNPLQWVSN